MNWGASDPALQRQVLDRQRITIENYANDPDLLAEHVGMEDNFQAGGYGDRQIEELLQNAIDQLLVPGRVELRLADGALYCANEGSPFGADGIKAVTGAFLSSKKDEKIGRFGLGFKSVLGVSERPQILSRSISFGFNEPEVRDLLSGLPYTPPRVPTLRVPSVLDPYELAAGDENLAELMSWASTIVKLPLARGGERLRERLGTFDARYLLFAELLVQVDITLDSGAARTVRTFRRSSADGQDVVSLEAPNVEATTWRVLHREHTVSAEVGQLLPGLFHRDRVRVSYALPVGQGRREDGEFWAWFPLLDRTTAQGLFNAPWQVNDDRTSMLPGSQLNRELLAVAAELLIEAAILESTPADPAKHFDVLPARGRETRSNADKYMSERIPQLARRHELIPTSHGVMRSPIKVRAPFLLDAEEKPTVALPAEVVRRWNEVTPTDDTPHWTCYSSPSRAARLRQLLTDDYDKPVCAVLSPVGWLSELANLRTVDAIDGALFIFLRLQEEKEDVRKQFRGSLIVPVEGGELASADRAGSILLPVEGADSPDGVSVVDGEFAWDQGIREKLYALGAREVSPDQVVAAAAAAANSNWSDEEWHRMWKLLSVASYVAGKEALEGIVTRRVEVKIQTRAGSWRPAREVFLDASSVPGLPARQPDLTTVSGRSDLLAVAGCLEDLREDYPVQEEEVYRNWASAMQKESAEVIAREFGNSVKGTLSFAERVGVGPMDVLIELSRCNDPAAPARRAFWTSQMLKLIRTDKVAATIDFGGVAKARGVSMNAPEIWCVEAYGLLDTTLGQLRPTSVLAPALSQFGEMLPVSRESFAGSYKQIDELAKVPDSVLSVFLGRDGYVLTDPDQLPAVLAVAAGRAGFASVQEIPALDARSGQVMRTPVASVVLATAEEREDLGSHGLRFIPSGKHDDILRKVWNLLRATEVIAKSVDWVSDTDPVPLTDVYPTLSDVVEAPIDEVLLLRCESIVRRSTSTSGVKEQPLLVYADGRTILVDSALDPLDALVRVSSALRLGLTEGDAESVIARDHELSRNNLVQKVLSEPTEPGKLLALVGREELAANLPHGLLDIIEERKGGLSDAEVADLFLSTYGYDSLRRLKDQLELAWRKPPRAWDGTPESEQYVTALGFPRAYAGTREKKAAPVELVPGRVDLAELHGFQKDLREQIRELVLIRDKNGDHRRGLLYLPTGAGKTRVTTESIVAMLRDEELASPILWIAQSEELCEQAIVSWTEVWRAIGDERPLEISRYWGGYEVDESLQELQVVVATDAKLLTMIGRGSNAHEWLRDAKLVVIDEAHRAGSTTYTQILRWLGIVRDSAGSKTERPLLGLTATPYRGINEEVNKQFVARFGQRRLNALDDEDPIGQLIGMKVLSRVEHQLLDGVIVKDAPTEGLTGGKAWDDVSRAILAKLGDNLDRTQQLVDHIMAQDSEWPILVFTPSVVSAHVTAALLESLGRRAAAVDGEMRGQERRRKIDAFKTGETRVLVNCDLLTQGFDAPKVRALYIARPTFSPNRYVQMVGRGLRGPLNGGTAECLVVNMVDTFTQFDKTLAYRQFDHLWTKSGGKAK